MNAEPQVSARTTSADEVVHRQTDHGNQAAQAKLSGQTVHREGSGEASVEPGAAFAEATTGSGGALPFQEEMEKAFGEDFSSVSVHFGAGEQLGSMGASAAAVGDTIAFADANPDKETVAHELTHVVQARHGEGDDGPQAMSSGVSSPNSSAEREAVTVGRQVAGGASDVSVGASQGSGVHREGNTNLSKLLKAILLNYQYVLQMQQKAITEIEEDAEEKAAPKLDAVLLGALAQVALSVACGAIGGAIAGKLISATAKAAQEAIKGAIAKTVEDGTKIAVAAASQGGGDRASLKGFFRGQWDTLSKASHDVQTTFVLSVEKRLESSATGEADAKELYAAQEAAEGTVKQKQLVETLSQWLVYMAREENGVNREGTANEGTDLSGVVGDTSRKGVLGIDLDGGYPNEKLKIGEAEMDGIGEGLAARIEEIKIGDLKIPITVTGDVDGLAESKVGFGMNEAGTVWDKSNYGGMVWLHGQAGHGAELWNDPRNLPSYEHLKKARYEGARAVIDNEIKPYTLKHFNAKVQTEGGVTD
jgi:hypothetical protein